MIVKDLIDKKDYDYIEWRVTSPKGWHEPDMFFGICESINGELISLDDDSYSENEVVLSYDEWSDEELDIKNGLTVVVGSK